MNFGFSLSRLNDFIVLIYRSVSFIDSLRGLPLVYGLLNKNKDTKKPFFNVRNIRSRVVDVDDAREKVKWSLAVFCCCNMLLRR